MKTDSSCEAVLFDLDGTLLDTIEDLADCMNATLAADGLPTVPTEQHKLMVGDGVRAYVLRALPEERHGDEDYLRDFTARFRMRYGENWANKTRPYDGVPELLQRLGEIGLPMAILSNKPDHATRGIVEHFLSAFTFAVVRGAMDGMSLKPDPAPALAVAREVGVEPAGFVYLGDTATDMQTARAAGMFAVSALWGFRGRDELLAAGAQRLIEHPPELLTLL